MFDATINLIKKRCSWQAVKTLDDKEIGEQDFIWLKNILKDTEAIYKSTMEEEIGKGLQMKGQDEIIGKDGKFIKLRCGNSIVQDNALPLSEDEQFEDALTSPKLKAISTVPRSKEEHENYNNLNTEFSKRMNEIS
ncbi:hypothetical protein C1646_765927 [Rhizophagus diaphanus]|nr:hypothetical protein C1646_765927 [Rhizophagus diaphanus] [Rhizophagus sp. MUCL 43196]